MASYHTRLEQSGHKCVSNCFKPRVKYCHPVFFGYYSLQIIKILTEDQMKQIVYIMDFEAELFFKIIILA